LSYETYSFQDLSTIISHPNFGQYAIEAEGIGSITFGMTTERTVHDLAADGNVMISKVKARNGTVSMSIQQTSSLQSWLKRLYNYLETADASQWAQIMVVSRTLMLGDSYICTGVSFGKIPDRVYQVDGQKVTWALLAADIQQD